MSEIIAKIGLDHARFDRGLDEASRGWEAWAQKVRRAPVQLIPEKSARESAQVFEEIERARQEHVGNLDRDRIERALGGGASGKSASESASVFEEQARAEAALAATRQRRAYDEANTVGRIRLTQRDLVSLAKQRDAHQVNTVARLRIEQQIEERLAQLRGLQRTQQASNILPSNPDVERRASGILGLLRKKFSGTDLFKDTIKGLGFGLGAGAIGTGISEFFSIAADRAKALAEHTGEMYQGTLRIIGVVGGPTKQLQLQERYAKDLNVDIEMQKKLVADLNANPINFLTDAGRGAIREAEQGVLTLIQKQAELRNQIKAGNIEEFRRNASAERQSLLQLRLNRIELQHGNELAKIDAQRAALKREFQILSAQGALPSTLTENKNQQEALEQAREIAVRNRREALEDTQRRGIAENNLAVLEFRHATDMEKFAERRRALEEELAVLRKRNASPAEIQEQKNRITILETERQIVARNHREKMDDLGRDRKLNDDLSKAELRDASEVEKKQIRLTALRREYSVLKERHGIGTETEANANEQRRLQNEIKVDQRNANRQLVNTLAGVGDSIAGSTDSGSEKRGWKPRPRGRSEVERIADRGRMYQKKAEEAARTGKSPEVVKDYADKAARDFNAAGQKISDATSGISKDTASALTSELLKTNQLLTQIRDNLKPQPTK